MFSSDGFRSPDSRLPMYVRLIPALRLSASCDSPILSRRLLMRSPNSRWRGVDPLPVPATRTSEMTSYLGSTGSG